METLDERRVRAMEVFGSSLCIYDRRRVRHDAFVGAWRRRRRAFDRTWVVLLAGVSSSDMPSVRSKEKVTYCQNLRGMMKNVGVTEIRTGVGLALWYFEKPYTKLHSFPGGRLRNRVLELEVQQRTAARNALLIG